MAAEGYESGGGTVYNTWAVGRKSVAAKSKGEPPARTRAPRPMRLVLLPLLCPPRHRLARNPQLLTASAPSSRPSQILVLLLSTPLFISSPSCSCCRPRGR